MPGATRWRSPAACPAGTARPCCPGCARCSGRPSWWRTTWTRRRWPSGRTATAGRWTASRSSRWAPRKSWPPITRPMPMTGGHGTDPADARKRGALEASASAPAVVRAARRAGMRGQVSARRVFTAAAHGDERAAAVVAEEAVLVARVLCAVVTVIDPELIVLGGGVGQAPGFAAAVTAELRPIAPVMPEVRVSALATDAVVDGCLASGAELAWAQLTGGPAGSHATAAARADGPGADD